MEWTDQPARVVAIIPARFASTRLPGKPLLRETGRTLIQHVVEAAQTARSLDRVIVATDDLRIADAVRAFGGEVAMTRADHPSGTDRVAEVAARLDDAEIIVNLQGDEPEVAGSSYFFGSATQFLTSSSSGPNFLPSRTSVGMPFGLGETTTTRALPAGTPVMEYFPSRSSFAPWGTLSGP